MRVVAHHHRDESHLTCAHDPDHLHPTDTSSWDCLPAEVRASWQRSARHELSPESLAPIALGDAELAHRREHHPLNAIRPAVSTLLTGPATEAGLLVAVADRDGTLLWVEGDKRARAAGEAANFVEGADWSDESVGANAPGLALATGKGTQVRGHEHYSQAATGYSCTAVPIFHPTSGALLGSVDITGGPAAVAQHSMGFLTAVVAAAKTDLARTQAPAAPITLKVLGHGECGLIDSAGGVRRLSLRHAEILLLLALNEQENPGSGMRSAELATQLWEKGGSDVTLRAEIVRLRKLLAGSGLDILSRPYRLSAHIRCDALELFDAVAKCDRARALKLAVDPLLPRSEAPAIRDAETTAYQELREMVLNDGTSDELLAFLNLPESKYDKWAHQVALRQLPPDAPERNHLVVALENWHD